MVRIKTSKISVNIISTQLKYPNTLKST
uniref:Uncharacterized protein MANES_18G078600 n=1 Tax=Rhizophora mucronata TaxID=61149 RepID=A0A2P2LS62_RHIMU